MTDEQRYMYEAWWATLDREFQEEADYIQRLPGGTHATAYLAVRQLKLEREFSQLAQRLDELCVQIAAVANRPSMLRQAANVVGWVMSAVIIGLMGRFGIDQVR